MKNYIIKKKRDIYIKIPLGIVLICLLGFSPLLIGAAGAWVTELITNEPCHEGNCFWGAFPWLLLTTIPVAAVLLVVFVFFVIVDTIRLFLKK